MITYDIEANGFVEDSTKVHCVLIDVDSTMYRLYDTYDIGITQREGDLLLTRENLLEVFKSKDGPIICHNQFGYDIHMLIKFFNLNLIELFGYDNLVDTYVWSKALYPDRPMPKGCPTTVKGSNGQIKRIGPHGLESWGYRVSRSKPSISDWSELTDELLFRCEEDVLINKSTYELLCKEKK